MTLFLALACATADSAKVVDSAEEVEYWDAYWSAPIGAKAVSAPSDDSVCVLLEGGEVTCRGPTPEPGVLLQSLGVTDGGGCGLGLDGVPACWGDVVEYLPVDYEAWNSVRVDLGFDDALVVCGIVAAQSVQCTRVTPGYGDDAAPTVVVWSLEGDFIDAEAQDSNGMVVDAAGVASIVDAATGEMLFEDMTSGRPVVAAVGTGGLVSCALEASGDLWCQTDSGQTLGGLEPTVERVASAGISNIGLICWVDEDGFADNLGLPEGRALRPPEGEEAAPRVEAVDCSLNEFWGVSEDGRVLHVPPNDFETWYGPDYEAMPF